MKKKINNKFELIIANDIYVNIQELEKIINEWQSQEIYRRYYDQGERGERLYECILADIAYHADGISDVIIANAEKIFGSDADIDFSIHPKSDIRSIGFEVLNLLDSWGGDPIENLTTEDIPTILEFLDTPPDKSLEAWDKWEQYWANLDYPARRKKLLDNAEE